MLTLPAPYISESCIKIEIKLTLIFIFTFFCDASKGFMSAFMKPFQAPQGSVKIES